MRGELGPINMLEAAEQLQVVRCIWGQPFTICHAGLPKVLVQKSNIFFYRNWKVSILKIDSLSILILILV